MGWPEVLPSHWLCAPATALPSPAGWVQKQLKMPRCPSNY